MDEEMLNAIKALCEALRSDLSGSIAAIDQKCDAIGAKYDAIEKKMDAAGERRKGVRKMDEDEDGDPDSTMARRTAADSIAASTEFSVLRREVTDMKKAMARPIADLNAFADVQAKADKIMRAHCLAAEPPMAGEDIVSYKIRQHRPMQKWSPKWKGVELRAIAGDSTALEGILTEIRADALQASNSPVGLGFGQYREITQESPGGHRIKTFIGSTETTGTIFKQMSRPVRHVAYIGVRNHSRA